MLMLAIYYFSDLIYSKGHFSKKRRELFKPKWAEIKSQNTSMSKHTEITKNEQMK